MEFKIDTRENYVHIAPQREQLNANMAAALEAQATQLADNGSQNFLIDLSACQSAEVTALEALATWHEKIYSQGQSLVFTGLQSAVMETARNNQVDGAINLAPTEIEAIDIINMEILERDLFGEES